MNSLCQLAADWRGAIPGGGALIEPKIDGWRAMRFAGHSGRPQMWTRQGMPIEGVGHILWQLDRIEQAYGELMFFDGEFQVGGTLAATKAWCERGWKLGGEAGVYHLFDAMPLSRWKAGGDPTPLYQRKAWLKAAVEAAAADNWEWRPGSHGRDDGAPPVALVEDQWVFNAADALDFAKRIWAEGGEGAVLKSAESPYQRKRTDAWQKIKPGGPWWKEMK